MTKTEHRSAAYLAEFSLKRIENRRILLSFIQKPCFQKRFLIE